MGRGEEEEGERLEKGERKRRKEDRQRHEGRREGREGKRGSVRQVSAEASKTLTECGPPQVCLA